LSEKKHKIMVRNVRVNGPKPDMFLPRHPSVLTLAIAGALAISLPGAGLAQLFSAEINLADLNGQNGFRMNGEAEWDRSGFSVSEAGDINGDGIGDLIIGSRVLDFDDNRVGRSYVVFGGTTWRPFFSLGGLTTSPDLFPGQVPGFRIRGQAENDFAGISVSGAGDINDDGIDDLIIGADNAGTDGRAYVLFGAVDDFPSTFDLTSINGNNGFVIEPDAAGGELGHSVSSAGDINGDGIDDLVISAPRADGIISEEVGRSYVVFGSASPLGTPINLAELDGSNGFRMNSGAAGGWAGASVSTAGDFNGDGIDDLIIGSPYANSRTGRSYVVFGGETWPASFNLGALSPNPSPGRLHGFRFEGEGQGDSSGVSVSAAGDVNGDGIDDLIIGAHKADFNGIDSGRAYVVFGTTGDLPSVFGLEDLDGTNGFVLNGESAYDRAGRSVSSAGDINGDGIDDLIIGATRGSSNFSLGGAGYVVFGSRDAWMESINLAALDGTNGFKLEGEATDDETGRSVSAAGDINGDGVDDLIIGAPQGYWNGNFFAGRTYVVFGRSDRMFSDQFSRD